MAYLDLSKDGDVFILTMIDGENDNMFTADVLKEYCELLNEVESSQDNASLILTSSHEKTWCNGLNLKWFMDQTQESLSEFSGLAETTFLRIALLNMPTIACITGNCYGGGAIMACAFDFRFMRADRGRFCLPGITNRIVYSELSQEIINLLPNMHAVNELVLTGKAMGGEECCAKNIVDAVYPVDDLLSSAKEFAKTMAQKDRETYAAIKSGLRRQLIPYKSKFL